MIYPYHATGGFESGGLQMRRSVWLKVMVLLGVVALLATACSDDSDSSDDGGGDGGGPELTGEPIELMVISTLTLPPSAVGEASAEAVTGAEAAAEAVNDAGGVNGSPIEIVGCDEKRDPNETARCGREAVERNVAAVVGAFSADDTQYLPVIAEAGIPSIANFPIGFEDFTNEYSFPIQGGAPGGIAGQAAILADEADSEAISTVFLEISAGEIAIDFADAALKPRGLTVQDRIPFPSDTPDATPIVAATEATDSDGILLALTIDDVTKYLTAASTSGYEGPFSVNGASIDQARVDQLGDAAEGVWVAGAFKPETLDDPAVQQFVDEMNAVDEDAAKNDVSKNSWAGVHLIAQVAKGIDGPVDGPALFDTLNNTGEVDLGIVSPFSFQEPDDTLLSGVITRIFNPYVMYQQVKDGEIVALTGDWVNPTAPPNG